MTGNIWSSPPPRWYFCRQVSLRKSKGRILGIIWLLGKIIFFPLSLKGCPDLLRSHITRHPILPALEARALCLEGAACSLFFVSGTGATFVPCPWAQHQDPSEQHTQELSVDPIPLWLHACHLRLSLHCCYPHCPGPTQLLPSAHLRTLCSPELSFL